MVRIEAPASSANLGPGFDTLGIALNVYNTFETELSETDILENCDERYNNANNLFLQAYRKGCEAIGVKDHVRVRFACDIPASRGMGSSAAFIAAGVSAASVLHENALSKEEIFQIATQMEGHPDNIAPCIYGGLIASLKALDNTWIHRSLAIHDSWIFTQLIPDFEVDTKKARAALPDFYSRAEASASVANAILNVYALGNGDLELLKEAGRDVIHEPYRAPLIKGFEDVREIAESDTGGKLLISGSGPSCLLISKKPLSKEAGMRITAVNGDWKVMALNISPNGLLVNGKPL